MRRGSCFALLVMLVFGYECGYSQGIENSQANEQQLLDEFCKESETTDRGVVIFPWRQADWVAWYWMRHNDQFQQFMQLTEAQIKSFQNSGRILGYFRPRKATKTSKNGMLDDFDAMTANRREFIEVLLDEPQRRKMLSVYLSLEGLMALRREPLVKALALSSTQQGEISSAIRQTVEQSWPIHQAIFGPWSDNRQEYADLRASLLLLSSGLDRRIVELLDARQRVALALLIKEANKIKKILESIRI